jgi:hypothetical protein
MGGMAMKKRPIQRRDWRIADGVVEPDLTNIFCLDKANLLVLILVISIKEFLNERCDPKR